MSAGSRSSARLKRKKRVRKNIRGTSDKPRLCVFRSARHIYAQIIDDSSGKTLVECSSLSKDLAGKIEGGCDVVRLLFADQLAQHRGKAKGGVGRQTLGICQAADREVGPVELCRGIDEIELAHPGES